MFGSYRTNPKDMNTNVTNVANYTNTSTSQVFIRGIRGISFVQFVIDPLSVIRIEELM